MVLGRAAVNPGPFWIFSAPTFAKLQDIPKYRDRPSEEVQNLLTLLFVQQSEVFKDYKATLTESWLIGAKLLGAWLQEADLSEAQLQEPKANADLRSPDVTSEERIRSRVDQNSDLIKAMSGEG